MNPLFAPAYPIAEAARYLQLPVATLRSWVRGRHYPRRDGSGYFEPLIETPTDSGELSFANLVEAHVLRALRQEHAVSVQAVRDALRYAQDQCRIERLLLSSELRTAAGELFLSRYGELINLSRSGQIALRRLLEAHLQRVEWTGGDFPQRLYPFLQGFKDDRAIIIDPRIAFGRPVTKHNSIATAVIADRIDAGESVESVAEDYDLTVEEVEAAVLCERLAA